VGLKLPVQRALERSGNLSKGPYFSVVSNESEAVDAINSI